MSPIIGRRFLDPRLRVKRSENGSPFEFHSVAWPAIEGKERRGFISLDVPFDDGTPLVS